MLSRLKVKKSYRRYNNTERVMPGAIIRHNGKVGVLNSQKSNGTQFCMLDSNKWLSAKQCEILKHNTGLVYI